MFRVMIVEDEVHILNYMKKKLSEFETFQLEGAFSSPEEALLVFDKINPDVVFLDIEMPRINGIDLARKMLNIKNDIHIIFTTAYGQYALDAFGVEAVDYLMKPIVSKDIQRVINRLNKIVSVKWSMNEDGEAQRNERELTFPVSCFGKFQLLNKRQQLIKWPTRKAEELFAYFVVHKGQHISKWELLELFWSDMEEERGLHNLYNTIYRIKQVIKELENPPIIRKINDGYILEAEEALSDLDWFLRASNININDDKAISELKQIFLLYAEPLFGTRDYFWSLSFQEHFAKVYAEHCNSLVMFYREKNQFEKAEEIICRYTSLRLEDEGMMIKWLKMLENWAGFEKKAVDYKNMINTKLLEAGLPNLN